MRDAGSREIEITSYSELALAAQGADVAHPAFAKLFVETEYLERLRCPRRDATQAHTVQTRVLGCALTVVTDEAVVRTSLETDTPAFSVGDKA